MDGNQSNQGNQNGQNGQNGKAGGATDEGDATDEGGVDATLASVSRILGHIDPNASIDAVVRMGDGSTLVRISPSQGGDGARFVGVQTALRVAFPFDTVAMIENMSTGCVQLQMVIATTSEQLSLAKKAVKELTSMRLLATLSNILFASSTVAFLLLFQHEAILQSVS